MPVLRHFGFTDYPFGLTPNTALYFPWEQHKSILGSLLFALHRGDGLLKVTGEVGTGKTMLCRLLLQSLVEQANAGYINAPVEDARLLPLAVCREFGVQPGADGDPYAALNAFLVAEHAAGRQNILVVDEAQALGPTGLEAIRLLSNLETDTKKLLQIVLFGQTELDRMLEDPSMRQVAQRINFSFVTRPLTKELAIRYIEHRIDRVSAEQVHRELFDRPALEAIVAASGGIPRVINVLADKALLAAFGDGARAVQKKHAVAAIGDSRDVIRTDPAKIMRRFRLRRLVPLAAIAAAVCAVALWYWLDRLGGALPPW